MIDTSNFDAQLQSIFDRYDPENDIAPGPAVTWADHQVAYSLVFVRKMLDDLQDQIKELAQDPPNPNMGQYQKLLNRLSECEVALIRLIELIFVDKEKWNYAHVNIPSAKNAFEYLVKNGLASWTDEQHNTIVFKKEEK